MSQCKTHYHRIKSVIGLALILFLLSACSQGIRIKNLVNYPLGVATLNTLDSLDIHPDVIKYEGVEEVSFRSLTRDLRLQGQPENRPIWTGNDRGCLVIEKDAQVHIADFNFRGGDIDTALIRVRSGHLILENCDFISSEFWAIEVDSGAFLELRNVQFSALRAGAIKMAGGIVQISDTHFRDLNEPAVYARGGELLEIHNSTFQNIMGTALELHSLYEVWFDSVRISDSFQDGVLINDCDFVLLDHLETRGNGRHGISLSNARICGIMNLSALGNLVNGLEMLDVDTLRILNSEIIGNGQSGGIISNTQRSRLAGIRVGHNQGGGLAFSRGQELWMNRSSLQANLHTGLRIDSLDFIRLQQISLVNNGEGVHATQFDSLQLENSLVGSNRNHGLELAAGEYTSLSKNLIKGNRVGLVIKGMLFADLDSNRIEVNKLGNDIREVTNMRLRSNVWQSNESGAYFSQLGSMSSSQDKWLANFDTGLEVFSVDELVITEASIRNNKRGVLLNEVSARVETSSIDSIRETGLKLLNGSIEMHEVTSQHTGIAVELGEGSRATIAQCKLNNNELALSAGASVSLSISFSMISDSRHGIQLGNYAEASLLSNQFDRIDGYCIELIDPYVQSVLLRQNVLSQTGGILNSKSVSGDIQIKNNTFAKNLSGIKAVKESISGLDHNIFYHTEMIDSQIMRNGKLVRWNCIYPATESEISKSGGSLNIFSDPDFGSNYYLKPTSACLNGGDNGFLIGALGGVPESRPSLQP